MRLERLVDDVFRNLDLDRRFHYVRVEGPPETAPAIVSSHDGVLEALRGRVATAGGAAPEFRLLRPRSVRIARSSVADVRRAPTHASEMVTQVMLGGAVTPLDDDDEWVLCRLEDGYIGWIRSWHLADRPPGLEDYASRARHRVAVNHAAALEAPDEAAPPVSDLVAGIPLLVDAGDAPRGWRRLTLPDGRPAWIRGRSLEPVPRRRRAVRDRLVATGRRFLGIPYLWGGNTPHGFDCSGLIQRIFALNGLALPRDSDLQGQYGRSRLPDDVDALRPGDLLFFGEGDTVSHVAMVVPDRLFLHAHGQVRYGSLEPGSPLYEARLHDLYRFARNPLSA